MGRLEQKRVLLGIGGGIAAYRSLELARLLLKEGAEVRAIPTRAATHFVTPLSLEAITGSAPMINALEIENGRIPHIEEAYAADLAIVAPATANLLARMANGLADDALTLTLLSLKAPLVLAPAMETRMWDHPATRANVDVLQARGARLVGPAAGALASGRSGKGRMAQPEEILEAAVAALAPQDLSGRRVMITAGPTAEDLDPVRFLTNRSTGKMGLALARACAARGAEVELVHGPLPAPFASPPGVNATSVRSAEEMAGACMKLAATTDLAILAAAVADFTPESAAAEKIKKGKQDALVLTLKRTPDILATLGQLGERPYLVGFAAETNDVVKNARAKLKKKGCDCICANQVAGNDSAFGADDNAATLIFADGGEESIERMSKAALAHRILDLVVPKL